ncbi:hypothetical protein D3C71_2078010 [compost metagenome]
MRVCSSITTNSMPMMSAKVRSCSMSTDWVNTEWWAAPARIQASALVCRSGMGFHRALATGSLGMASGRSTTSS